MQLKSLPAGALTMKQAFNLLHHDLILMLPALSQACLSLLEKIQHDEDFSPDDLETLNNLGLVMRNLGVYEALRSVRQIHEPEEAPRRNINLKDPQIN